MSERVSSPDGLGAVLSRRPATVTVVVEEASTGRQTFDGPSPEWLFVREANELGYDATVTARGGEQPYYGWMGPGTRWFELRLTSQRPVPEPARPELRRGPAQPAQDAASLVRTYHGWVAAGEYASCFGDWVRRQRAGQLPMSGEAPGTLFWLNALAAYAGLCDGRASSGDLAMAAGLAESNLDRSRSDQVDFAARIRSMYEG